MKKEGYTVIDEHQEYASKNANNKQTRCFENFPEYFIFFISQAEFHSKGFLFEIDRIITGRPDNR
jgi:hypothetical protein